jgi:hypothetical protein
VIFKEGGEITNEDKYKEWKTLVNMSHSELSKFIETKEGKEAGLSREEASDLGISSGRDSARAILRMKQKPFKKWNESDLKWMQKQINFIKRMRGNSGELFDEEGNKTRKHTSLLIWGHNPVKYDKMEQGGRISTFIYNKDGINIECYVTTTEHASIYGVESNKPLYLKGLIVDKKHRNKGKGKEALQMIEDFAIKNNCDTIVGYVASRAEFTKNKENNYTNDTDLIKNWLKDNGYSINEDNNDFHKVINIEKMEQGGGISNKELDKALSDLHRAETLQETMKKANAIIRSNKNVTERLIKEVGFSEDNAKKIQQPDFANIIGFAQYQLTNNNAYIKRLQDKINLLNKKQQGAEKAKESGNEKYIFDGGEIEVNYELDRVQILFPGGRVDKELYQKLRKNGYVFSPTNKAFQRKLTPQAISNACYGLKNLDGNGIGTKKLVNSLAEKVLQSTTTIDAVMSSGVEQEGQQEEERRQSQTKQEARTIKAKIASRSR